MKKKKRGKKVISRKKLHRSVSKHKGRKASNKSKSSKIRKIKSYLAKRKKKRR